MINFCDNCHVPSSILSPLISYFFFIIPFVDEKKRFGDFEIDTIIGRNRKGAIMTTNDRCTHLVLIRRLAGKEATQLASTAIEALLPYKDKIHTITADNGKEFARHKEIAKGLDAEFYFARPYHS